MSVENNKTTRALNHLVRLCHSSERGFNVAAENVGSSALKVLYRSYAQERARFATALCEAAGLNPASSDSLLAAAHRGWINIKAVMTLGPANVEKVVLAEVLRGEIRALAVYESALRAGLEGELQALILDQYARLRSVHLHLQQLQGTDGMRLLVQLQDGAVSAQEATRALRAAGVQRAGAQVLPLSQLLTPGDGTRGGNTLVDTTLAGALLGVVLGVVLGLVVTLSARSGMGVPLWSAASGVSLMLTLLPSTTLATAAGAFLGAIVATGLKQEDSFSYAHGLQHNNRLLFVRVEAEGVDRAKQVMSRYPVYAENVFSGRTLHG